MLYLTDGYLKFMQLRGKVAKILLVNSENVYFGCRLTHNIAVFSVA
ncbi:hypothetical protein NIES4074_21500 [Cylindrospermum sp. NIES-4074]|nr:hypothetical protein NIES4074_21500 [Cylindrospermum sp. NIES-4074]